MALAGTFARDAVEAAFALLAPLPNNLPYEQAHKSNRAESKQIRVGVREQGLYNSRHSPVIVYLT